MGEGADSILQQAFTAFDSGKLVQAEQLYLLVLRQNKELENDKYKIAVNGLAFTYSLQENFERARELYRSLYELVDRHHDLKWQAIALHQLGMVERLAGNFEEAQRIFRQEYDFRVSKLPNDFAGLSANLYEQAYLYLKFACLVEAEQEMTRSLEVANQAEDFMCMGCSHRGLGEVHQALGNVKQAREAFLLSEQAFAQAGDEIAVLEVQRLLNSLPETG